VILLTALLVGLVAGWARARKEKRPYRAPELKFVWLVPAALLLQLLVAYLPAAWQVATRGVASAALPLSLVAFLVFVWVNRGLPGMPILLAGLVLNLLVISSNGGWMPISPETATHLPGGGDVQSSPLGSHFGQKDILLLPQDTQFEFLSDRLLLPDWFHYAVAFSVGDILVAIGAFWLLARPRLLPRY
jgi:hypothetical protein